MRYLVKIKFNYKYWKMEVKQQSHHHGELSMGNQGMLPTVLAELN